VPNLVTRTRKEERLRGFRYAVSCIEEANRIKSLKLLVEDAKKTGKSIREVSDELEEQKEKVDKRATTDELLAYRLA
jgi:hypothetical protein